MKKTIFSGIQPSGTLTLGNYLGTLKNWSTLQDDYDTVFCIVDMHALTVRINPEDLRNNSRRLLMTYMSTGICPQKSTIYYQSHVSAHAELAWILNCFAYMGELNRMTQFKEKSQKHESNINVGLFTYPVLMAADILLYQTDVVPVGDDQKQHLEMAREIALRFNNLYGDVFKVPEVFISKISARIKGLQNPNKKMSKSNDDLNDAIFLADTSDIIAKKIKRAITDSEGSIYFDPENKPGVSNLLTIYACITKKDIVAATKDFDGKNYGYFKNAVTEVVADELTKLQQEYAKYESDKEYVDNIIKAGAQKANTKASQTLKNVYEVLGCI